MSRRTAISALIVAVAYYVGAEIGLALTLKPNPVSTCWPPNAILLAALLLTPVRSWWAILLSALPAHLAVEVGAGIPMPMVLCWFISNCSEAIIGAALVRRLTPLPLRLDTFTQVLAFALSAGLAAPFLSSFLDAGFVWLNGFGESGYWHVWRVRCFSNALTDLTLVPVIVTFANSRVAWGRVTFRRHVEAWILGAALVSVCGAVFVLQDPAPGVSPTFLYAPLPFLLWAAMRFGPRGISAGILTCAVLAIWGATGGRGPFVANSPADNALSIQLFMIVMSVPLMTLAAVIEERRAAGVAVARSRERVSITLSAAQLCTWEWDLADNRVEWSDQAGPIVGLESGDLPTTFEGIAALFHADDRATATRVIERAIRGQTGFEFEVRRPQADGSLRWILCKGRTLRDQARGPSRIIGVLVDVTDRKRVELEAETHRSVLAHLGRVALLGELSGTIAHELNQPLTAILANARAGQRFLEHDPPNLTQVHDILDAIADDDRRAGDVIARMRALLSKEDVRRDSVDVNDILRRVIYIARSELVAHEVSVVWALTGHLPPVAGDHVQLQQVVLNLVLNACDSMRTISRNARRVTLRTSLLPDDTILFALTDTGVGISHESIERIFEPFVTTKLDGLGLGLAICRSIVSAHEGRLWVENNAGGGATFYLALPAAAGKEAVATPGQRQVRPHGTTTGVS